MNTPRKSLKGKTRESFSAVCVARSAEIRPTLSLMWKISTFQEATSTAVINVVKSLTPKTSYPSTALVFIMARSRSEYCFIFLVIGPSEFMPINVDARGSRGVIISEFTPNF